MQTIDCPFDNASLDSYPVDNAISAVIICPGGRYEYLSQWEDTFIAQAFNVAGYHAFVLHYSVTDPPLGWRPLRQLAWAVSAVRAGISGMAGTQKVAVCGFSAGGHLAASLGVQWHNAALFAPQADLDMQRPDALILCYPVISGGEYAHQVSFTQLAGEDATAWNAFSLEKLVSAKSVPTFLWHTVPDMSYRFRIVYCFLKRFCGMALQLNYTFIRLALTACRWRHRRALVQQRTVWRTPMWQAGWHWRNIGWWISSLAGDRAGYNDFDHRGTPPKQKSVDYLK